MPVAPWGGRNRGKENGFQLADTLYVVRAFNGNEQERETGSKVVRSKVLVQPRVEVAGQGKKAVTAKYMVQWRSHICLVGPRRLSGQ